MKENIINFEYFVHSCFTCLAEICYHFAINTDNKEVKKDKISVPMEDDQAWWLWPVLALT